MPHEDLVEFLHLTHPRTIFVKSLRRAAVLLDMGAGNGSLQVLRGWLKPLRRDITMYAYAMEPGEGFKAYDRWEVGEWPKRKPDFGGENFDGIFASHFIEHIPGAPEFIGWAAERLKPQGRLYLEWPSPNSKTLPTLEEVRSWGIPIIISNYHDDATHRDLPERTLVVESIEESGMVVEQVGFISNPLVEEEALAQFKKGVKDEFLMQSAFWSHTRWAQFVVASKP
jgi:SAM-dependent methyltransferase